MQHGLAAVFSMRLAVLLHSWTLDDPLSRTCNWGSVRHPEDHTEKAKHNMTQNVSRGIEIGDVGNPLKLPCSNNSGLATPWAASTSAISPTQSPVLISLTGY